MSTFSTSSIGSTAGQFSVGGLVSGIDANSVIEGLLSIEQRTITRIDAKTTAIQAKRAAYKAIEARLLSLQGQMTTLSRAQNGAFAARTVQSSDDTILTAAASSSAVAGVYQLRVNSLAKAHQIASQGFDSLTSAVTQGTMQIKVGDATTSVTIDATNNTLQGLADAINNASPGLSASIVNDGSGDGRQAFRLILAAKTTGTSNRITITNNLGASGGSATKPIFDASSIGNVLPTRFSGTSTVQANSGAGYTGSSNNVYKFTVVSGGTVGTDNNLQVSYADATGANTGVITLNSGDAGVFKTVAQGMQVQFAAGTLVAGDTFDVKAFIPTVQEASDASVSLGSGSGALQVTSATNQIDSLFAGVALQLNASNPAKDITLTVANDVGKMKTAIQDFIDAYNDVMDIIDTQIGYNADTKQAGPLLGDRQALAIQEQVRSALANVVAGANPSMNNLGALGITANDKGRLVVNDARLTSALQGSLTGVTLNDVRKLFALAGSSTNPGIQFVSGSTKTLASAAPYTVRITQAAEKATLAAATSLAAATVIDGTNNTFSITLDGKTSETLTLAQGTYTRQALAQAVQSVINGDTTLAGRAVTVGLAGDALTITSASLGSSSQLTMQAGAALTPLGFTAGVSAQGRDAVGSYLVNGATESARGSGQFLVGDSGNANTADLQVRVTLTPTQVGAELLADVTISRGVASRLDQVLTSVFDSFNGRLKTVDNAFEESLKQLDEQKSRQNVVIEARRERLLRQFTAMESVLSKLQSVGSFLTSQAVSVNQK